MSFKSSTSLQRLQTRHASLVSAFVQQEVESTERYSQPNTNLVQAEATYTTDSSNNENTESNMEKQTKRDNNAENRLKMKVDCAIEVIYFHCTMKTT